MYVEIIMLSSHYANCRSGAGVTVYSALRKSGAQAGEWVVLLGAGGGLGHLVSKKSSYNEQYEVEKDTH